VCVCVTWIRWNWKRIINDLHFNTFCAWIFSRKIYLCNIFMVTNKFNLWETANGLQCQDMAEQISFH